MAGIVRLVLSPDAPLAQLARNLHREAGAAAALAGHTVILPHGGLTAGLARGLHDCAGGPCVVPRMFTLEHWMARQPVPPVALDGMQRVAELQKLLAARSWLAGADHWAMAAELGGLFDELGQGLDAGSGSPLPATEGALAELLAQAHQVRDAALFRLDARLVHELWHACEGRPEWGLSRWQRDALAMAHLLEVPEGPLWVFDAGRCTPQALRFFERYAARERVTLVTLEVDMPGADAGEPPGRAAWVAAALRADTLPLGERAQRWRRERQTAPPEGVRVRELLGREGEGQHACDTVCAWLAEGLARIAVVACDRALARRLRALLERRGVLAEDKAGWVLATTRVGAAARDLLRLQRYATPALLRALMDSPLVVAADQDALRMALGAALDRQPANARLDWQALNRAASADAVVSAWLEQLQRTLTGIASHPRPLDDWIGALLAALDALAPDLGCDPAGAQLLAHLQQSRAALNGHAGWRGAADFADWLDWTLGETLFRDDSVQSPVLLTHPGALRGLDFDAILVAGADAAHLPAVGARPRVVRDAARAELGLPDSAARRADAAQDWCLLMGSAPRVEITWQTLDDRGEPVSASPFVLLMQRFHRLAWGTDLPEAPVFARVPTTSPAAFLPLEQAPGVVPAELSPTGYQALLDCPYKWFVRDGLRLRAPEEAVEDTEPSDFGEAVHRALRVLHERQPRLRSMGREAALQAIDAVTTEVFAPLLARDFGATAWLERWREVMPAYVDWQLAREDAGWQVDPAAIEARVSGLLAVDANTIVGLRGTPDRIDEAGNGARVLIDYKTGSRARFEGLAKDPTEDAQLVLYAHMVNAVDEVAYLPLGSEALDKDGALQPVTLAGQGLQDAVAGHAARLAGAFRRLAAGERLPAMGDARACKHCDARGLCRKDHRATP